MSYLVKQKVFYYKKYKTDIWNAFKNTLQVTHSTTFYSLKNSYKRNRKLKGAFKYSNRVFLKLTNEVNQLKQNYNMDKTINNLQKLQKFQLVLRMFYLYKTKRFIKLLLYSNLARFLKHTVSNKVTTVFTPLIEQADNYQKTFFRKPFIYESKAPMPFKKRRKINEQFVSFRFVKLFYVIYNYRQLKKIARKAKLKSGVFEQNYLLVIECKLPSYLYRTSFFPTIFESLEFVKANNVWVNKEFKPLIFYTVKLFDIVGFRVIYKNYILWNFFKRLRRRAFAFMFSRCIYVSFHFWFTILISRFTLDDLVNSFSFDYYRIATYAQ